MYFQSFKNSGYSVWKWWSSGCVLSLMNSSHSATVGQLSGLFQPQSMRRFYGRSETKTKAWGHIFQGVSSGLLPHNNGVQAAGRNVIKCQLRVQVLFKFSHALHLRTQCSSTLGEVDSSPTSRGGVKSKGTLRPPTDALCSPRQPPPGRAAESTQKSNQSLLGFTTECRDATGIETTQSNRLPDSMNMA